MSRLGLTVYGRLPGWARSVAASLHGYRLRRWRYGADLETLVESALERDYWPADRLEEWQRERLDDILPAAAAQIPSYRAYWTKRDIAARQLKNWPVLEKDALRSAPRTFLSDFADPRKMYSEHTSGTTGKPLHMWIAKAAVRYWYALGEARWKRWYGVSIHDRWGILGGQLITPVTQRKPPFWVWNAGLKQLYLSSYHLSPELARHYVDALRRYNVRYLLGYPSALHALALAVLESGRDDVALKVAIGNAEPLLGYQRDAIASAFHCPVRETYGMSEAVAAASECEAGRMHLWPEPGVLEVLREGGSFAEGSGELIATGLLNPDMPLIRYRTGDSVTLSRGGCACGRTLPLLSGVEGRTDDLLQTLDGRVVGRMDPVFKGTMPLREAQIVQEELDRIRVVFVPAAGFSNDTKSQIEAGIQARMGCVKVEFEQVAQVPRGSNGKFRAVVSKLPAQMRCGASEVS